MKLHALDTAEIIQLGNFDDLGWCVAKTWEQKQRLDKGTNPPAIEKIIALVKDYTLGFELPGAGGGGYVYLIAKDAEAAVDIKRILHENPPNNKARFVEMSISHTGMQITRS
jgi:galactokinase/mevalonate kinase-like predicted kinase